MCCTELFYSAPCLVRFILLEEMIPIMQNSQSLHLRFFFPIPLGYRTIFGILFLAYLMTFRMVVLCGYLWKMALEWIIHVINPKTIMWAGFSGLVPACRIAPGNIAQLTFSTCICLLDRYKKQLPDWEMLHHNQPCLHLPFSTRWSALGPLLLFSILAFILPPSYFYAGKITPSSCPLSSLSIVRLLHSFNFSLTGCHTSICCQLHQLRHPNPLLQLPIASAKRVKRLFIVLPKRKLVTIKNGRPQSFDQKSWHVRSWDYWFLGISLSLFYLWSRFCTVPISVPWSPWLWRQWRLAL